jgi:hypothetical protein
MKNLAWQVSAALVLGCSVSACFSDPVEPPGEPGSALSLAISIANDQCGIAAADALVTAPDMEPISAALEVTDDAIVGLIEEVPAGPAREVRVRAYDSDSLVVYEGSTVADVVAGETTSLTLTLRRNFDNCPGQPVEPGTGNIDIIGELDNSDGISDGVQMLPYRVVDAEYSASLGRVVMISDSPAELHIYDPATHDSIDVALPLAPAAVSVAPDGLHAAVGHNGWMSYVSLETGELEQTWPVSADVLDIVLAGNGFAHAFPRRDQWVSIHSIDLATGQETLSGGLSIRAGTLAKLHPTQLAIYGADNGLSPSDIEKYGISGGTATYLYDSPYHGDYAMCGNLWISADGLRIFTACGNVFRSSEVRSSDMIYNGALSENTSIRDLSHSLALDRVAVAPRGGFFTPEENVVDVYSYEFLNYRGAVTLPDVEAGDQAWPSYGRFVFFDASDSSLIVIVQADESSGLLNDYGVHRIATADLP